MKKLRFIALFLILPLIISCSQIQSAVNTLTEKTPEKLNLPVTDTVRNVENASPDAYFGDKKADVVSVLEGGQYYVGGERYPLEDISDVVKKALEKNPPFPDQLVYLNSAAGIKYGDVVKALYALRKADIQDIGLRVDPKNKGEARFYILQVKIPAEPKDEDFIGKPNPLTLVITLAKDGTINLNREPMRVEDLKIKLKEIFADRAGNGVLREGTNEVEKTIYIKAPRSASYRDVVLLIDAATGAGASPVGLQIDDLED